MATQTFFWRKTLLLVFLTILPNLLGGCFLIRGAAGANVDLDQLAKARSVAMLETRKRGAENLSARLANGGAINNADMTLYFSQDALNKAARQLDSATGWLDDKTTFVIKKTSVVVYNGSAVASLALLAHNSEHNVDVDLVMDCIMEMSMQNGKLISRLEPFNIAPNVSAGGALSIFDDIIKDIITVKVATMNQYLPPMEFPVDFDNTFGVQATKTQVRTGVNMDIEQPARAISYGLQLKEVLFFEGKMLVAMNITKIGVK